MFITSSTSIDDDPSRVESGLIIMPVLSAGARTCANVDVDKVGMRLGTGMLVLVFLSLPMRKDCPVRAAQPRASTRPSGLSVPSSSAHLRLQPCPSLSETMKRTPSLGGNQVRGPSWQTCTRIRIRIRIPIPIRIRTRTRTRTRIRILAI